MVSHAGVVKAVEIGKVQHLLALVPQDIHVIFQQNLVPGQSAGLVHAQVSIAAKALHGIDVFDHCLLFSHRRAALS